jgi:hypothetical protein
VAHDIADEQTDGVVRHGKRIEEIAAHAPGGPVDVGELDRAALKREAGAALRQERKLHLPGHAQIVLHLTVFAGELNAGGLHLLQVPEEKLRLEADERVHRNEADDPASVRHQARQRAGMEPRKKRVPHPKATQSFRRAKEFPGRQCCE